MGTLPVGASVAPFTGQTPALYTSGSVALFTCAVHVW